MFFMKLHCVRLTLCCNAFSTTLPNKLIEQTLDKSWPDQMSSQKKGYVLRKKVYLGHQGRLEDPGTLEGRQDPYRQVPLNFRVVLDFQRVPVFLSMRREE